MSRLALKKKTADLRVCVRRVRQRLRTCNFLQSNMTSNEQRAALQRKIWDIANDVRGAVDGWDFKQYVLGTLNRPGFQGGRLV